MNYLNLQLHEVVRTVLDDNPRGVSPKQIAARLSLSLFTVLKWGEDPEGSGATIPVKYILAVSEITGDHSIVEWFARHINRRTVPIDRIAKRNGYISDELFQLDQLRGELSGVLLQALDDGRIDDSERGRLRDLAAKMVEMLYQFQSELEGHSVRFTRHDSA